MPFQAYSFITGLFGVGGSRLGCTLCSVVPTDVHCITGSDEAHDGRAQRGLIPQIGIELNSVIVVA